MRRINKAYEITNNVIRPFKTGTQQHLENADRELAHMLAKMVYPDLNDADGDIQILYGCENTGSGSNYIISAGAIMYKDPNDDEPEIFFVAASTFTVSGGNVPAAVVVTTSYTGNVTQGDIADPVLMSDQNSQDVHDDRRVEIIDGNSGSPGFIGSFLDFFPIVIPLTYTAATLNSPFTNTGGAHSPVGYLITKEGFVKLRGRVSYGSGSSHTLITAFTLPVGYRPQFTITLIGEYSASGGAIGTASNSHQFSWQILTTGEVQLLSYNNLSGSVDLSMDGIEFPNF